LDLASIDVAVVGATGAVGLEVLGLLASRGVEPSRVRALASARSAGKRLAFGGGEVVVERVSAGAFEGVGVALLAASAEAARRWAPVARAAGADVIDNSSAFRLEAGVPLVVPEVNPDALPSGRGRLVANPNCSTIIMLMAVTPLRARFGCRRLVVSTYQAVSGAGAAAMDELREQSARVLAGETPSPEVFGEVCAFNVFSHDSKVDPATGRNSEEDKLIRETRKIWADGDVEITATCVRVPVFRAHTESINITLVEPATEAEVRAALGSAPGVRVVDDRATNRFPTPRLASGGDDVLVGRLRPDAGETLDEAGRFRRFDLLCSGDQLRKGAALNAVQIAECLGAPA